MRSAHADEAQGRPPDHRFIGADLQARLRVVSASGAQRTRSTGVDLTGLNDPQKLNELAELLGSQRFTKPLHYHCANPALNQG
jgi:hypothetical protein